MVKRCFLGKVTCKKAYEREIIITVKLEYMNFIKKQAEKIISMNINHFLYNPLE